jgi:hypothetical protein
LSAAQSIPIVVAATLERGVVLAAVVLELEVLVPDARAALVDIAGAALSGWRSYICG